MAPFSILVSIEIYPVAQRQLQLKRIMKKTGLLPTNAKKSDPIIFFFRPYIKYVEAYAITHVNFRLNGLPTTTLPGFSFHFPRFGIQILENLKNTRVNFDSPLLKYRTPRRIWPIAKASSDMFFLSFFLRHFPLFQSPNSFGRSEREVDVDE